MHRPTIYKAAMFLVALLLAFSGAPVQAALPAGLPSQGEIPPTSEPLPIPDETLPVPMESNQQAAETIENPAEPSLNAVQSIVVWDESALRFGQIGYPQRQVNIQGRVNAVGGYSNVSLYYSLNGSTYVQVPVGGTSMDSVRLGNPGDFNVALDLSRLMGASTHRLDLLATDSGGGVTTKTVYFNFNYTLGRTWPMPYYTNWSAASSINDQAQVVDGLWRLAPGGTGVQPVEPGYDRLIAIGDYVSPTWREYEVVVPITVHSWHPVGTDAGGVGLIVRWQGHTGFGADSWQDIGAYGYYSNRTKGLAMWLSGDRRVEQTNNTFQLQLGVTYIFKLRVETYAQSQGRYSLKVWRQGEAEPSWADTRYSDVVNVRDDPGDKDNGSILLVAHRVNATFGNVSVYPLSGPTYPLTVNQSGSGSVRVTPTKSSYAPGETIQLQAIPASGWTFTGWTGIPLPNSPTVTMNMPAASTTVTANFRQSGGPVLDEKVYLPFIER